jgi:tripartite-type tricarboxylate transporter receptor subunit TctC
VELGGLTMAANRHEGFSGRKWPILDRRSLVRGALSLAAVGPLATTPARAQAYPSRNITLVVPFPPGGSPDILGRLLARKLEEVLGKPIIIENRGGAGGTIAAEAVSRAPADGYTLLMGHIGTLAAAVGIYPHLKYDPVRSFQPVSMVARVNNLLVVNPALPVRNVQDLIDHARKMPGKLNYASGGNGSAAHIAMEAFADAARIELMHVPYRGTNPAVTDVIAGHVQLTLTGATALLEHVRSGKLRALGVAGPERLTSAPDIPTIAETLSGFEASQWYGVVAPAGTPETIVEKLNAEIRRIMASPEIVAALVRDGAQAWVTSPDEFRAFIVQEIARWGELIRRANIRAD